MRGSHVLWQYRRKGPHGRAYSICESPVGEGQLRDNCGMTPEDFIGIQYVPRYDNENMRRMPTDGGVGINRRLKLARATVVTGR